MNQLSELIPEIAGEIKVFSEEEIAADERSWQNLEDARRRDVLNATRDQEMITMNVPRGTLDLMSREFDVKLQPKIPAKFWYDIAEAWKTQHWLTLIGPPGVGKTDVAIRLLWKNRLQHPRIDSEAFLFLDASRDARTLMDRFGPDNQGLWDRIERAACIVLDDVGYAMTERQRTGIASIIRLADANATQLLITSNCGVEDLKKIMGDAAMSRVMRTPNQVLTIKGRDVRQIRGKK